MRNKEELEEALFTFLDERFVENKGECCFYCENDEGLEYTDESFSHGVFEVTVKCPKCKRAYTPQYELSGAFVFNQLPERKPTKLMRELAEDAFSEDELQTLGYMKRKNIAS
jgi:hypothetical protein